jgi:steroid delta-isomerase-like uncharacterized protein
MSEANKATARRFFDAYSKGDLDEVAALMADEHVFHFILRPEPMDKEAHLKAQASLRAAAPDLKFEIEAQYSVDDLVISRGRFAGTHQGTFMGLPATGKRFNVSFMDIMRLRDGKNIEEWDCFDTLALMRAVGAVPHA